MTIRDMRVFMEVCENGNNLSRAAKKLYMTQPSVSLAIQEIEKEYGVLLFDRISRRLYLTQAGEEFRRYAQRILALYDELDGRLQRWNTSGTIRIGASMTIGSELMPQYVEKFEQVFPQAQVRVLVEHSVDLEEKLLTNELDLALLEIPVHHELLRSWKFMEDSLLVVAPLDVAGTEIAADARGLENAPDAAGPARAEDMAEPGNSADAARPTNAVDARGSINAINTERKNHQGRVMKERGADKTDRIVENQKHDANRTVRITGMEQLRMTPAQLASSRLLLREKGSGTREVFEQEMAAAGLYVQPIWEAGSTAALISAVRHGMGLSVLPRRTAEPEIQVGHIRRVQIDNMTFRQDFFIVAHRDKVITPMLQGFIDVVTK